MNVVQSVFPDNLNAPETAQSAIGQRDVQATPMQMAMVAAAIANGGRLMTPYVVQTVRSADLTTVHGRSRRCTRRPSRPARRRR